MACGKFRQMSVASFQMMWRHCVLMLYEYLAFRQL